MKESDPLSALLKEWRSPEPSPELDRRMVSAYRERMERNTPRDSPLWIRFWRARISVPAPLLTLAALAALAIFVWFRQTPASHPAPVTPSLVTQLNATGFEPLPNGAARVVPVSELNK
jgi:anti-sigma-K factor RskA